MVMRWVTRLVGFGLAIALAFMSATQTIRVFAHILPPDMQGYTVLGLTVTDVAFIVWGMVFLWDSETAIQKAVAILMMLASAAAVVLCVVGGGLIESSAVSGFALSQAQTTMMVTALWVAVVLHSFAWLFTHMYAAAIHAGSVPDLNIGGVVDRLKNAARASQNGTSPTKNGVGG